MNFKELLNLYQTLLAENRQLKEKIKQFESLAENAVGNFGKNKAYYQTFISISKNQTFIRSSPSSTRKPFGTAASTSSATAAPKRA